VSLSPREYIRHILDGKDSSMHKTKFSWYTAGIMMLTVFFVFAMVSSSYASDSSVALDNDSIYKDSLAALTMLFVLAVLLESALSVIFNWRLYLVIFNSRGVKTLIMLILAWVAVDQLGIDIVADLLGSYIEPDPGSQTLTKFITALILAGGSAGVNNLMVTLGYRDPSAPVKKVPTPLPTQAWVSIRVIRDKVKGPIFVRVNKIIPDPATMPIALAGTINQLPLRRKILGVFFRNPNYFPQSGGYVLEPGKAYDIQIEGQDEQNNKVTGSINGVYSFAPGAIVDFDVTL
jgi:hypothetical protein